MTTTDYISVEALISYIENKQAEYKIEFDRAIKYFTLNSEYYEGMIDSPVRSSVWDSVRISVWDSVRISVGNFVMISVDSFVRSSVRSSVGISVENSLSELIQEIN